MLKGEAEDFQRSTLESSDDHEASMAYECEYEDDVSSETEVLAKRKVIIVLFITCMSFFMNFFFVSLLSGRNSWMTKTLGIWMLVNWTELKKCQLWGENNCKWLVLIVIFMADLLFFQFFDCQEWHWSLFCSKKIISYSWKEEWEWWWWWSLQNYHGLRFWFVEVPS